MKKIISFILFLISIVLSFWVGKQVSPSWSIEKATLQVQEDGDRRYYIYREKRVYLADIIPYEEAMLHPKNRGESSPTVQEEYCYEEKITDEGTERIYYKLTAQKHWKYWSLLPAVIAVLLCWITKEPIPSLLAGIVSGALLLGKYDIPAEVLIPALATKNAAAILILYLWLLGGLTGIWSRTGAAKAFAETMTRYVVRGPRTAKLVAWFLGVIFFQGGTMSTVLVGTTVKPIADKENVSHEELAYIVDSTASPIASQIAFNAWPGYVQAFIYVPGVYFLATEADRITFFFHSVPFCFYAIFAVLGTFLLSIEKPIFIGKKLKAAIKRVRTTGKLDAEGAEVPSDLFPENLSSPSGYKGHVLEFILPLVILIGTAIGTFILYGSPKIVWAFSFALLSAASIALIRGLPLKELMGGFNDGIKSVVAGSVILLLALTIGGVSKETGGGAYLVECIGGNIPYWTLPVILQCLTVVIAFSTGTSWGTYAVAFPLAMPVAWSVANANGLEHPQFFMTLCFAAVMDGSVFGDQCSPISDTTVLSSMCTGCDLMDHVTTQLPQASMAALLASICWTIAAFFA